MDIWSIVAESVSVRVQRPLVKWGNGFGIRLTTEEARILGLHGRDLVQADVRAVEKRFNPPRLQIIKGTGRHASRDHDKDFGEALDAGY